MEPQHDHWKSQLLARALRRGVAPAREEAADRVVFRTDAHEIAVRLDNLMRALERSGGDETLMDAFLDGALDVQAVLPPWPQARQQVLFSAERPPEHHTDAVLLELSQQLCAAVVCPDRHQLFTPWVCESHLAAWGIGEEELLDAAATNMAAMLAQVPLEVNTLEGVKTGMLVTDSIFKASLVMAPNLRQKVEPVMGWPVLAVLPHRDFLMLLGEGDMSFVPKLGRLVADQFRGASHPLSTEVLRCGPDGVVPVGTFGAGGDAA